MIPDHSWTTLFRTGVTITKSSSLNFCFVISKSPWYCLSPTFIDNRGFEHRGVLWSYFDAQIVPKSNHAQFPMSFALCDQQNRIEHYPLKVTMLKTPARSDAQLLFRTKKTDSCIMIEQQNVIDLRRLSIIMSLEVIRLSICDIMLRASCRLLFVVIF